MESNGFPIWWVVVRQEPIGYGISCFRIIKAVKTTLDQTERLYHDHVGLFDPHQNGQLPFPMFFHREPDTTPLTDKFERDMGYKA